MRVSERVRIATNWFEYYNFNLILIDFNISTSNPFPNTFILLNDNIPISDRIYQPISTKIVSQKSISKTTSTGHFSWPCVQYWTVSDGEIPVMEIWGMWSTHSLPLIPDSRWPRVIAPVRVLSIGPRDSFESLMFGRNTLNHITECKLFWFE